MVAELSRQRSDWDEWEVRRERARAELRKAQQQEEEEIKEKQTNRDNQALADEFKLRDKVPRLFQFTFRSFYRHPRIYASLSPFASLSSLRSPPRGSSPLFERISNNLLRSRIIALFSNMPLLQILFTIAVAVATVLAAWHFGLVRVEVTNEEEEDRMTESIPLPEGIEFQGIFGDEEDEGEEGGQE